MNITRAAGADARRSLVTASPCTLVSEKAGRGLPSGSIMVEGVRATAVSSGKVVRCSQRSPAMRGARPLANRRRGGMLRQPSWMTACQWRRSGRRPMADAALHHASAEPGRARAAMGQDDVRGRLRGVILHELTPTERLLVLL